MWQVYWSGSGQSAGPAHSHASMRTHGPQQPPRTDGTMPGAHVGGRASQSTSPVQRTGAQASTFTHGPQQPLWMEGVWPGGQAGGGAAQTTSPQQVGGSHAIVMQPSSGAAQMPQLELQQTCPSPQTDGPQGQCRISHPQLPSGWRRQRPVGPPAVPSPQS